MKVLVCGGNDFDNRQLFFLTLDRIHEVRPITEIVEWGVPTGASLLARQWATLRSVPSVAVPADFDAYPKRAIVIRNKKCLRQKPDVVVAFPGGDGTSDMLIQAKKAGVPVFETWKVSRDGDYTFAHMHKSGFSQSSIYDNAAPDDADSDA